AGSVNADNINAPLCIDFSNFCDGMLLSPLGDGTVVGEWRNNDCAGATAPVHGSYSAGLITVTCTDQSQCPVGIIWKFNFDNGSRTFDMFGTDGVNPPFPQQINQPYRIGHGTCPFGSNSGIPSTASR